MIYGLVDAIDGGDGLVLVADKPGWLIMEQCSVPNLRLCRTPVR